METTGLDNPLNLDIWAGQSQSSQSTFYVGKDAKFCYVYNGDSDQTARECRLI